MECNIDNGLDAGDTDVVSRIAKGHGICKVKNNTEINFYSFATKYCSWHNNEKYPIYDGFVEKTLIAYRGKDNFSDFKNKDLKDFEKFCEIVSDFANYYVLSRNNLKNIDKFL